MKKANEIIKEHLNTLSDEEINLYLRGWLHDYHLCPTKKIREMADAVVDCFFNANSYKVGAKKTGAIHADMKNIGSRHCVNVNLRDLILRIGKDFLFRVGLKICQDLGGEVLNKPTEDRYQHFEEDVCNIVCVPFYINVIEYITPYMQEIGIVLANE